MKGSGRKALSWGRASRTQHSRLAQCVRTRQIPDPASPHVCGSAEAGALAACTVWRGVGSSESRTDSCDALLKNERFIAEYRGRFGSKTKEGSSTYMFILVASKSLGVFLSMLHADVFVFHSWWLVNIY